MYIFLLLIPSVLQTAKLCFTPELEEKLIVTFESLKKLDVEDANSLHISMTDEYAYWLQSL